MEDRSVARKIILVADDDRTVREVVAVTLGPEDFLVLQARDGREALEMARSTPPNLVLLDVLMPEMDGVEVCRQLKRDPLTAGARVIFLTASSSPDDQAAALEAGAYGFFLKPFSPIALLDRVYEALQM